MKSRQKQPVSRLRRFSSFLFNVVVVVVAFVAISALQSRNMLSTNGQAAPALQAATLLGGDYNLVDAKGRPALVYFFAPWCSYCKASSDNLVRLRRWRDETELEILTVVLDWQHLGEVRAYAERHELNMPVLLGDMGVARDWQVYAFPTYYVLDSAHRVVRRDLGYSTQFGLWWRSRAID